MQAHAVAAVALRRVERGIGGGDESAGAELAATTRDVDDLRNAEAGRDRHRLALGREIELPDLLADALGHAVSARHRGVREDDRELLAAVAARDVAGTERVREEVADALEDEVAEGMAEVVVELLEVIEVDHDERDRAPAARAAGDLRGETLVEVGAVAEPGERVDLGPLREQILRALHA